MPFGMVKLGLDTYEEPINQSALNGGWTPQGYVTGISLMHESGTGGGPKYVRIDISIVAVKSSVSSLSLGVGAHGYHDLLSIASVLTY